VVWAFNEGRGAYQFIANQDINTGFHDFVFTLDGSTQTRYKPVFAVNEFYPVTQAGTNLIISHYRCDCAWLGGNWGGDTLPCSQQCSGFRVYGRAFDPCSTDVNSQNLHSSLLV
jgi:hypothetical protein